MMGGIQSPAGRSANRLVRSPDITCQKVGLSRAFAYAFWSIRRNTVRVRAMPKPRINPKKLNKPMVFAAPRAIGRSDYEAAEAT
jgi:predicted DNA-binding transcriptional regulator AlpA